MSKTRVLAALGAVVVCGAATLPLAPALFHQGQHSAVSSSSLSDSVFSAPGLNAGRTIKRIETENNRTISLPKGLHTDVTQTYVIKSGDTLSAVAKLYHTSWKGLYCFNRKRIGGNPNVLTTGTKLVVKSAFCKLPDPVPVPNLPVSKTQPIPQPAPQPLGKGVYFSCGQLETLWTNAGGPASVEVTAASIAMAESGGYEYATEPTTKAAGLWQILGTVVPGDVYNPVINAENAVKKYDDAGGFSPWTTYTSGSYLGRC